MCSTLQRDSYVFNTFRRVEFNTSERFVCVQHFWRVLFYFLKTHEGESESVRLMEGDLGFPWEPWNQFFLDGRGIWFLEKFGFSGIWTINLFFVWICFFFLEKFGFGLYIYDKNILKKRCALLLESIFHKNSTKIRNMLCRGSNRGPVS